MNINDSFSVEQNHMNLKKNVISNHIISLIIFANAFQIAFMSFGIYFDMWIEYILIAVLFAINKFKVNSLYNVFLLLITISIFLYSLIFFNNEYSLVYLKEFILYSLPLIFIFMVRFDYKELSKTLYKYSLLGSFLYVIILTSNNEIFSLDYMTYGYNSIYFSSYVFIYSYYNEKKYSVIYSLLAILFTFIYGPRGGVLVVGVMLAIMVVFGIRKSLWKKLFFLIIVVFGGIYGISIARYILSTLIFKFNMGNYSIFQFYNMLSALNIQEMLGSRYSIYKACLAFIEQNPLSGLGIGGFQSKIGLFPHNIILDVFVTFGLFLGSLYFIFIFIIGKKTLVFKNNLEIKIFFIFIVSNLSKLLVSKTFVYDSTIWLYIVFCVNSYITYKKTGREFNDFNHNTYVQ